MVNMISVPFSALIIAHEQMRAFAAISIFDAILKFLIAFILVDIDSDKLIIYSLLILFESMIIRLIYGIFCRKHFREIRYKYYWNRFLFRELLNYASWNIFGNLATVFNNQGINILLNIFLGPVVNAARGIASQVSSALSQFVSNFQTALNPQIIKSFARNENDYMFQLIYQGAKYSFFLLFSISLPVLLETKIILNLWLKTVPEYTLIFTRLVIVNALINTFSGPLMTAAQASGKIKLYQGIVGGLLLLCLPITYIFLRNGFCPEIAFYINIFISIIALYARLKILTKLINLDISKYIKQVILKSIFVALISSIFPFILYRLLPMNLLGLILTIFSSIISSVLTIYLIGLNKYEKIYIRNATKKLIFRIGNKKD